MPLRCRSIARAIALSAPFACFSTQIHAVGAVDCAALPRLAVPSTTITSAALVSAANGVPEHCSVSGHVDTEINFALRLPTQWNQKFLFQGLGGLDGLIPGPGLGLQRGYAEIGTDTGHVSADGSLYDGSWAYNNPERQINWAYRSTHVVAVAGKFITNAYYAQAPAYSYYMGCSGGGRHATMAATRYPQDFNAVVAGAPFLDPAKQVIAWNWDEQALATFRIPPPKLAIITNTVVAQCDAADGVVDGLITDPRRCQVDLKAAAFCRPGSNPSSCLTAPEVVGANRLYSGPKTSGGTQLFPGWQAGAENPLWLQALVNSVDGGPGELLVRIPDQFLTYFVFGPGYNPYTFNFDTDPPALSTVGDLLQVKPQLTAFAQAGGKILMYHGWADPRLAPTNSIAFHDAVKTDLAQNAPNIQIDDFYRLFMVPGMGHCSGGPGPSTVDWLTPVEQWVERGVAPQRLIGSHVTSGSVDFTRPLCVHPAEAVYTGQGSTSDAANFQCLVR